MKLSLSDIVQSLICDHGITNKEIYDTVELLLADEVCQDRETLLKVGKLIKTLVDYEKSPAS